MSLFGWVVAVVGFIGFLVSFTPLGIAFLPEQAQVSVGVWAGVAAAGLLVAMFTRRARN